MESRRVQQLRIRGDRPERIGQAAVQLEDALRTASFANLPRNGVVYIRRLDLGRIGSRPQSPQLSRRIERALRSLPAGAIYRGNAELDLPDAEAVWFPDPVTALKAVADRILSKLPLRAWYWRRVLGLPPVTAATVDLDRVFACAEQQQTAEPAVMSLLKHLHERGALLRLIEQLPLSTLRRQLPWLEARVVTPESLQAAPATISSSYESGPRDFSSLSGMSLQPGILSLSSAAKDAIFQLLPLWRGEPERSLWGILVLHQLESQTLAASSWRTLRQRIVKGEATGLDDPSQAAPSPRAAQSPSLPQPFARAAVLDLSALSPDAPLSEEQPASGRRQAREVAVDRPAATQRNRRPFPDIDFDWAGNWLWGGEPTHAAGLFFVLPIWRYLGMESALQQHPWLEQAGFPYLLLKRLGAWLGLPSEDPMLNWMPSGNLQPTGDWRAPSVWLDLLDSHLNRHPQQSRAMGQANLQTALTGRVLLNSQGPWPPSQPMLQCLADSWLRLTARWLNQHGLRLRLLVERRGLVAATETHLDVCLPLGESDLTIRRLALDLDPGWVSWLGRVIQYHYLHRESADA